MKGGLLALLFFVSALPASAANLPLLDPNFSIVPKCPDGLPLGPGGVLQLIQNVMNAGISIGVIAFVLVITYAGFLFILTPTNPESRSKAKTVLGNATIGFIIVLAAWLIVDFIMKILYSGGGQFGPWNKILTFTDTNKCIQVVESKKIDGLPTAIDAAVNGVGISGGSYGGSGSTGGLSVGRCAIQSSGPCSVTNLTSYFGDAATTFSKICSHESSGCAVKTSTTDKTAEGQPVSFGCLQVNISAHPIGGYNCPAAFTSPLRLASQRQNVHIKNQSLYEQCKAAALNNSTNLQYSADLYRREQLQPWVADKVCYQ